MDWRRTSTGSLLKRIPCRARALELPRLRFARRLSAAALLAIATLAAADPLSSGGLDERKLLEPERAFSFSARALDPSTIEARFAVAPGYYLYRDKFKLSVESAALKASPLLPPGKLKH